MFPEVLKFEGNCPENFGFRLTSVCSLSGYFVNVSQMCHDPHTLTFDCGGSLDLKFR